MPDPKWFSDDAEWVSGIENAKEADLTNWQLRGLLTKQLGMLKRAHANIAELRMELGNAVCETGCGDQYTDGREILNRQDPPEVTNE